MHQIIRGTTETAELEIYYKNELTNADGQVLVTIIDADYPDVVLGSGLVAFNDPALGKYTLDITSDYTSLNRVLSLTWSYTLNTKQTQQEEFYEVYTPYATVSDIVDYFNFGTRVSDLNYRDEEEIKSAEFMARMQIENYVSMSFGKRTANQEIFGNGSDALELTERMNSITKIYEDGILVIDYTSDPVYNIFGWNVELTPTYKALRIINSSGLSVISYDNVVDPTVPEYGRFRDASRYRIYGEIGWPYVPQDIRRCAVVLSGDYLSMDANWRQKYLNKVTMGDVSFEMAPGAFNGTGNILVDRILDSYRNIGIMII